MTKRTMTEEESWKMARQKEQNFAVQIEAEQDALDIVGAVLADRWTDVRKRFDQLSPTYAAAVAIMVVSIMEGSGFNREPQIAHFKRWLLEAL